MHQAVFLSVLSIFRDF